MVLMSTCNALHRAEYVFQVCGMLKYTDKMCSTGTSICERYDKNLTSKENYGDDAYTTACALS